MKCHHPDQVSRPNSVLKKLFVLLIVVVTTTTTLVSAQDYRTPRKSNIVMILPDDLGYGDLSSYGAPDLQTPNIDALVRGGIRLDRFYANCPVCSPTRAALLSGQHSARNGMWHVIGWYGSPWARVTEPAYREQLPRELPALPKALRAAGYRTGMAGKWHLTTNADGHYTHLRANAGPAYGFDFVAPPGKGSQNEGDKWVDHLTDQAIGFMSEHRNRPWFFYLASIP